MINKLPAYNLSSSSTPNCRAFLKNLRQIVKCGICGHRQKIEFHHIKPTSLNGNGRGMNRRALDIIKHPDAYIPLCWFCHRKVTQDTIKIIWNSISEYLGWITTMEFNYNNWRESDLRYIHVI